MQAPVFLYPATRKHIAKEDKSMSTDLFTINEVIIYLRKSRSDDPAMSVEEVLSRHERQLQEYAESLFGEIIPERHIFREVVSGETISDRPVMREIMKLLETGSIKGVLVIEPQRLSRGDLEDCGRIINTFRYTNTIVLTPTKHYDLADEYDRKFFEMELTRGNDYLEYTKKILNRGRLASVKQGNYIGSVAPYGYRKVKIGTGKDTYHTLEIIPDEADALKLMYHLFIDEGYGFSRIARHLDSLGIKPRKSTYWSSAAIKDMLENPVYIGKIRWNRRKTNKVMVDGNIVKTRPKTKNESDWVYVQGKHPAIIDEDTFRAALDKRGKNPCVRKNRELSNPYAGILFCGTCGKAMSYKKTQGKTNKSYIYVSLLCNQQALCHTKSVSYKAFEERVIASLENAIADFKIKLQNDDGNAANLHNSMILKLEHDLQRLIAKDARQKDAYEDGVYTKAEYAVRNAKLQEQISETMETISHAKETAPISIDYHEKIMRFSDCLAALQNPSTSALEKNKLLKSCVEKIIYYNNNESRCGIGRYVDNPFDLEIFLRL